MIRLRSFFVLLLTLLSPAILLAQQNPHAELQSYYIPYHIYDTQSKTWIDLETLLTSVAQDDVVFLGEQHNDQYGHQLELAIIEGAARRRPNVVLAMEMFERDVQPVLNNYLTGKINETEFLSQSRPWPNYLTDYRPLVEFARSRKWQVVGSNAPTRLARAVSLHGIDIVEKLSEPERRLLAEKIECPHDEYWTRFSKTMASIGASHGVAHGEGAPNPHTGSTEGGQPPNISNRIEQLYQAQCVKDETMAESVSTVLKERESTKPLVIHVNGDFHSAFGEGTAARARRRLPNARIKNVSFIQVSDLDRINVDDYAKQGNFLIFTLAESESE